MIKSNFRHFMILALFVCTGLATLTNCSQNKTDKDILKDGMNAFQEPYGDWKMEEGQLVLPVKNGRDNRTNLWLKGDYSDFQLELDFKLDTGTNSGVFFRTTDTADPVQSGIEVQVRDDYGNSPIDKHFCGSVYDIKEVSQNRVKQPGKWNHLKIICQGRKINVFLNGASVVDIDLKNWDEVGKNPDGSENKFQMAYKDMPTNGEIGFQDHGGIVRYRNIWIKKL